METIRHTVTDAEPIMLANRGPALVETNYFEHELADKGLFFLSANAGAVRLLMPHLQLKALPDMKAAKSVVLTTGRMQGAEPVMLEIMFDDETDSPFALYLSVPQQVDLLPAPTEQDFPFIVYGPEGPAVTELYRTRAHFRRGRHLPDLRPWSDPVPREDA